MKIVCDACSAKYSIADEKVQGKVFKIRCKKCSNIIVVRGTGGAEEVAAPAPAAPGSFDQKETRVYDYGGYEGGGEPPAPGGEEGVWHIVVEQEQVGPLTVAEVQARFAAGEIDGESYIWREGFADWLPLSQVPDFAHLVASGSTTTAQPSSGQDAVASMFGASNYEEPGGTSKSDPNDVFAAHAAKATEEEEGAGDLFGQRAAAAKPRSSRQTGDQQRAGAPREEGGLFGASDKPAAGAPPAAAGGAGSSMRGQRNENSVLFSLGNLAALASDAPRSSAPSGGSAPAPGAAAHGGGEGSGLIDIRSMASAYLGPSKSASGSGGPRIGSADDLPVFSTAAFSEPAVIIPSMGGSRNNNKMMYILLAAIAVLAVIAVVLVVVVMGKDPATTPAAVATNDKPPPPTAGSDKPADPPTTGSAKGSAVEPTTGSATDPGATTGSAAVPPTGATDPGATTGSAGATKPADPVAKPSGTSATKPSGTKPSGTSATKPPVTKPPPVEAPDTGGKCLDEVGCMLAAKAPKCCERYSSGRKPPTPTPTPTNNGGKDLPESLTKADISAGVAKVQGKVSACGAKSSAKGTVKVSVKVAGSGSVSSVTVKETPDPGLGSCVGSAMQKASFAKTQTGGTFSYPFRF